MSKQPPHWHPWPDALKDNETMMGDDAMVQRKFRLLSSLQIPLGKTEEAVKARMSVLQTLLDFDETVMGTSKHKLERNTKKVIFQYALKIPYFQQVVTNFRFTECIQKRNFFDNLWQCMFSEKDLENDKPAELFCHYLAKHHNDSFLKVIPRAKKIHDNANTIQQGLIMYDGGSIYNVNHVAWNKHYAKLLDFQKENGHCMVANNDDKHLHRWTQHQRLSRRLEEPALTPKRIQLLDDIGFSWESSRRSYDRMNDPKFHKTLAAKLFFNPDLLNAKDAMALSGFIVVQGKGTAAAATAAGAATATSTTGTDVNQNAVYGSDDDEGEVVAVVVSDVMTAKRLNLHDSIAKFYEKEYSYTKTVREILMKLSQMFFLDPANAKDNKKKDDIILDIFGPSETLKRLLMDGKLIPRHESDRPWLKSTTDSSSSSSSSSSNNTGSTVTNSNNRENCKENDTEAPPSSIRDEMVLAATVVAAATDSSKDISSTAVQVVRNDSSSCKKRKRPPPSEDATKPDDRMTL